MKKRLSGEIKAKPDNVTLWPHTVLQRKKQGLGLDTSRSFYWEKEIMMGKRQYLQK